MSRPRPATELFRLALATDGAFPSEAAGDFLDLILSAFPPKSKATGKRFVPAEFPGELEEQILDDIRAIAADNPSREAEIAAAAPPAPDAKAQEVANAAEAVRAAVRGCFVGMRLRKPQIESE